EEEAEKPMPLFDPGRLTAMMEEESLQALVTARETNVFYLTRYRPRGAALAVVLARDPNRPVLILPSADIDFWLEEPDDAVRVEPYGVFYREAAAGVRLEAREERVLALHRRSREEADPWGIAAG